MERNKRIRRKIIKSLRDSIKTPIELAHSFEYIKPEEVNNVVEQMLVNGELFQNQENKLDLWRSK